MNRHQTARADTHSFSAHRVQALFGQRLQSAYFFEKAIAIDPNYASAWAGLGAIYDLKGSFLGLPELSLKAIECEEKAIALNPRLAQAHQFLGGAYLGVTNWEQQAPPSHEAAVVEAEKPGGEEADCLPRAGQGEDLLGVPYHGPAFDPVPRADVGRDIDEGGVLDLRPPTGGGGCGRCPLVRSNSVSFCR